MKIMKYAGLFLVVWILGVQVMVAQQNRGNRPNQKRMTHEQMSEMSANRLADELALDDKTTALFKKTYISYMNEIHQLWMNNFPKRAEASEDGQTIKREKKQLTDAEVEKMIKNRFTMSRKMLDIREKYYDKFREFLSPKQIQKIYDKEMNDTGRFQHEMNRRAGMKGPQRGQRPPMPRGVDAKN